MVTLRGVGSVPSRVALCRLMRFWRQKAEVVGRVGVGVSPVVLSRGDGATGSLVGLVVVEPLAAAPAQRQALSHVAWCRLMRFWRHKAEVVGLVGVGVSPVVLSRGDRGDWSLRLGSLWLSLLRLRRPGSRWGGNLGYP